MKRLRTGPRHDIPTRALVLSADALTSVRGGSVAQAAPPGAITRPGVVADPFYHGG